MKVAFLTHYTKLYGANRSLLNLIDGLKTYEVLPYVISPSEGDITDALRTRDVPVEIFPIQWWMSKKPYFTKNLFKYANRYLYSKRQAFKRLYVNLRLLQPLVESLRRQEIDVVYTNSSVIPSGAIAAKLLGIPHLWHMREFGNLDYGLYSDWGTAIHKEIMNLSDAFIAISEAICNHLLSNFAKERVHVIYNGIASEAQFEHLYYINQQREYHQQTYTFALVGLIHPCKGQEIAIRSLSLVVKKFPTTRLIIVGSGDTTELQQLASSLDLENNIEFWGYVEDPYTVYQIADAVLMCSRNEAMGRVTAEAMAACRPVIGYDNAGTSELIKHEETGLLYKGDHEALARYMLQVVEHPEWSREMGKNAWHFARKRFTIESYSQAVYKTLLSISS